jgi:hypothetical protein
MAELNRYLMLLGKLLAEALGSARNLIDSPDDLRPNTGLAVRMGSLDYVHSWLGKLNGTDSSMD